MRMVRLPSSKRPGTCVITAKARIERNRSGPSERISAKGKASGPKSYQAPLRTPPLDGSQEVPDAI